MGRRDGEAVYCSMRSVLSFFFLIITTIVVTLELNPAVLLKLDRQVPVVRFGDLVPIVNVSSPGELAFILDAAAKGLESPAEQTAGATQPLGGGGEAGADEPPSQPLATATGAVEEGGAGRGAGEVMWASPQFEQPLDFVPPGWPSGTPAPPAPPKATLPPLAKSPAAEASMRAKGVLFFLFTVQAGLPHVWIWQKFFESAPLGSYRILVHCVNRTGCLAGDTSALPGVVFVETMPSQRCTDLVTPQWGLFREATRMNVKPGAVDKFIMLSESCLPVKPFGYIHRTLTAYADTDICLEDPKKEWQKTVVNGIKFYLVKHSQWAILTREHAQSFVAKWTRLDASGKWSFMMPGKMLGGATFMVDRRDKRNWRCADEFAIFATLFGLFVPGKQAPDQCQLNHKTGCRSVEALMDESRCRTAYYFTRTEKSKELKFLLNDKGTKLHWRGDGHPVEVSRMSRASMEVFRQSAFLFARKFSVRAQIGDWPQVMFVE
mmetsp:Transcript_61129/g.157637  ORF Transcript_61129/g.157637 Transcript_61129/m.157637 type:complete len:491 (+) Transcript_61129:129-1601(+)